MVRVLMQHIDSATTPESAMYLTLPEASRRLGVSVDTLRRRVKAGRLPAVLFAGKYRIRAEDLDELVRSEAA